MYITSHLPERSAIPELPYLYRHRRIKIPNALPYQDLGRFKEVSISPNGKFGHQIPNLIIESNLAKELVP